MSEITLKCKVQEELKVERGDMIYLKDLSIDSRMFLVTTNRNIGDGKLFLLNDISSGRNWSTNGITEKEISELIERYRGRLIKSKSLRITVEEVSQ